MRTTHSKTVNFYRVFVILWVDGLTHKKVNFMRLKGQIGFLFIFITLLVFNDLYAQNSSTKVQGMTLVIDPGHGGKDPGAEHRQANCMDEKHLNLRIALKLGDLLEKYFENLRIVYTRKTDKYVSLEDRVKIATANNADCFISLHINANEKSEVHGVQVHIHAKGYRKTERLAELINKELTERANRSSLGIFTYHDRKGHLFVLQNTTMTGVLVECGFLTNEKEEKFVNTDYGQDILASAIFRAFRSYAREMKYNLRRHPISVYRVQIAASANKIPRTDKMFKKVGLKVHEYKDKKNLKFPYKYTVGRSLKSKDIQKLAQKVRKKGFPKAFIVKHNEYPE